MSENRFKLAGWLSITNAILYIPGMYFGYFLAYSYNNPSLYTFGSMFDVSRAALFVYTFYIFKTLMNDRFQFHKSDKVIKALIWSQIIITFISIYGKLMPEYFGTVLKIIEISFIPFGILHLLFSIILLKLPDSLSGYLKPFAYTLMVNGVFLMSKLAGTFAFTGYKLLLFASVISYILLGLIFLKTKEIVEFV